MKIAFISDIHGNAVALEAVLEDIEKRQVDKIMVLGDICFRGLNPKRSLELVQNLNTNVIKGNADEWVARGIHSGEVPDHVLEMMNKEREWTVSNLDVESIKYLENLPLELDMNFEGVKVHAFHATPKSLFEVVLPSKSDEVLSEKMMCKPADIYIYAHIHRPFIRYIDGKCLMNIGSVGLPFDGSQKSSYGLLEVKENTWTTSIVKVTYDVNQVINMFSESNYPNAELIKNILKNGAI